jgi:PKD domain-containing protein
MTRHTIVYSLRGVRATVAVLALALCVSLLFGAVGAKAVVVEDESSRFGVALVPETRGNLAPAGTPAVTSSAPCADPALAPDLLLPEIGLCWHGGGVMHANETFVLTWDPVRSYFATTKEYVQQFLRDVADGSSTLTSPYAVTGQYTDGSGRAANESRYGGACTDFGEPGGSACDFTGPGAGHNYPASGCPVSGTTDTVYAGGANYDCVTDAQIKGELATIVAQTGILGRTEPGYTPMLVLLMPPGVEICLDGAGKLCSAATTSAAGAQFCSYHSQVSVGGAVVPYLVQPWTALAEVGKIPECDEPKLPEITPVEPPHKLAVDLGIRLVNPLSQAQIATITDPGLDGWSALDGSEVNDNMGCKPLGPEYDTVTVGASGQNPYVLQREFNNGGAIELDPNAQRCTPEVELIPTFVVPSAINQGDLVQFDGSTSASTLVVPRAGYEWDFGDGTTAVGPSVEHSYGKGGTYTVKLTLTDRGGDVRSVTHAISVLGPTGQVVAPPAGAGGKGTSPGLHVKLQLLPQGLKSVLRHGVSLKVTANEAAAGIASISIARSAAKRAHLSTGHSPLVVIGVGTVKGVGTGTVRLHLRLTKKVAAKVKRLRHVTLTVRLTLIDRSGDKQTVVVAGRY